MTPITPELETLLARVAERHAEGSGWLPIARELGRDVSALRALCADAADVYNRLFDKARSATFADSLHEAVFVLRNQIRSDDETAARRSAECLSRTALAFERDRLQRLKWQAAQDAKAPTEPEQFFPDTPAGLQARRDWESGKHSREMTPQMKRHWEDLAVEGVFRRRGWLMPGRESAYATPREDPVAGPEAPETWHKLAPAPGEEPTDDEPPPFESDDDGDVPRGPAPVGPGGQCAAGSGQKAENSDQL